MNPKYITYLDQYKKVSSITFRLIFLLYWVLKIAEYSNDRVLNILVVVSICLYLIRLSIDSMLASIVDKIFYKRAKWLSLYYLSFSMIIFLYYYEILGISSFIHLVNMGIAMIVVLYFNYKNR